MNQNGAAVTNQTLPDFLKMMIKTIISNDINFGYASFEYISLKYISLEVIATRIWKKAIVDVDDYSYYNRSLEEIVNSLRKDVLKKTYHLRIKYCKQIFKKITQKIGEEIMRYFNSHSKIYTNSHNLRIFWNNLQFTNQGTVDHLKTAENIIDHSSADIMVKFDMACNNCLIDKILKLMKNLTSCEIKKILTENNFDSTHMTYFWFINFYNNQESLSKLLNEGGFNNSKFNICELHDYLLKWTIHHSQEISLQYIWTNSADNSKEDRLIDYFKLAMKYSKNYNILLYLFAQMNNAQHEEICVTMGYEILQTLQPSSRLREFLIHFSKYVFTFVSRMDVIKALKIAIFCWQAKIINLCQYHTIWNEICGHFNDFFVNEETFEHICYEFLLDYILSKNDGQTLYLFFRTVDSDDALDRLCIDTRALIIFNDLIYSGNFELIDFFLRAIFPDEIEVCFFKKSFLISYGVHICFELIIMSKKYKLLDKVLIEFNANEDFKMKLPYKNDFFIIYNILALVNIRDDKKLRVLNNFLSWCFDKNEDEVSNCKRILFNLENGELNRHMKKFIYKVRKLIFLKNMKLAAKYWNFLFYIDHDKIETPKKKLHRIRKILYLTFEKKGCGWIKDVITNCFKPDEVEELRKQLKKSNVLEVITRDLIQLKKFSKLKDLLMWCFSKEELIERSNFTTGKHRRTLRKNRPTY